MGQRQSHLLDEHIINELYIKAGIDQVYDYVTQPERWHEWQPTAISANTNHPGSLPQGQRFTGVIDLLGVQVHFNCRVITALPPREFKAVFSSIAMDGTLHYQLQTRGNATLFKRTLHYTSDLHLSGIHSRLVEQSNQALHNLRHKLEIPPR